MQKPTCRNEHAENALTLLENAETEICRIDGDGIEIKKWRDELKRLIDDIESTIYPPSPEAYRFNSDGGSVVFSMANH